MRSGFVSRNGLTRIRFYLITDCTCIDAKNFVQTRRLRRASGRGVALRCWDSQFGKRSYWGSKSEAVLRMDFFSGFSSQWSILVHLVYSSNTELTSVASKTTFASTGVTLLGLQLRLNTSALLQVDLLKMKRISNLVFKSFHFRWIKLIQLTCK